jgi:hypothetical protein
LGEDGAVTTAGEEVTVVVDTCIARSTNDEKFPQRERDVVALSAARIKKKDVLVVLLLNARERQR